MRAFIVRPFGEKKGLDFERIDRELIQAAFAELRASGLEIEGSTTASILEQGNIREDMFRLLVIADLVIADASIHNANAYYELGIRHGLRAKHTILLRSENPDAYPFDLQTDRYFPYDSKNPGARAHDLAETIRRTLASENADSPLFKLLPGLRPHGRHDLVRAPGAFIEDVSRAQRQNARGDLRLYADEAQAFEWDQEGLRIVGEAQFKLRAFAGARDTFERLRKADPHDLQANLRLATIYQRLAAAEAPGRREDLRARSDQAIDRALTSAGESTANRAEAKALSGSNHKSRWIDDIATAKPGERAAAALRSPSLPRMLAEYLGAYNLDLNAHYPGVNALAFLKVQIALAELEPAVWASQFDDDRKPATELEDRKTLAGRLEASLTLALELDAVMGKRTGVPPDNWAGSSRADLQLLTRKDRPERVAQAYREALHDNDRFNLEATRRNVAIYADLGLFEQNVRAALAVIDELISHTDPPRALPTRVILFTGHMVDAADREAAKRRFPRTKKAEDTARSLVEAAIEAERKHLAPGESIVGISGGACGGDILFLEACERLGIPTQLYLALPKEKFRVTSVQHGGADWEERFNRLCDRVPPRVLQQEQELPRWLVGAKDYNIWTRNNLWMLHNALAVDAQRQTLIALYNPEREPDGPGGTKHMIENATKRGFKAIPIDARVLLEE